MAALFLCRMHGFGSRSIGGSRFFVRQVYVSGSLNRYVVSVQ